MVESETVEDRGHDVAGPDWSLRWKATDRVAGTHNPAPLHATSGEGAGEALGPVVTSARRIHSGGAAEFREPCHERVVEHATLAEILDQGGVGLVIHRTNDFLHPFDRCERLRAVDVPGDLVEDREEGVDRYESHAVLDQPPRQQAALPKPVHAIPLADRLRLLGKVEGGAGLRACHQPVGHLEIFIEQSRILAGLKLPRHRLHDLAHLPPPVEPGHADLVGRQQVRHAEVGLGGVGHQRERILRLAEKASRLSVGKIAAAPAHQLRQHDERRQVGPPAEQMGCHAAGVRRVDAAGKPPSGLHHLPASVVHRSAVVAAGPHERKLVGDRGMFWQQFRDLKGV